MGQPLQSTVLSRRFPSQNRPSHPERLRRASGFGVFIAKAVKDRELLLLMVPGFLFFLVYSYIPFAGILIGFTDYTGGNVFHAKWIGVRWFVEFFRSPDIVRIVRNTVLINLYSIVFGFMITIFFALMLNEIRFLGYKKFVQTASYLPYFISTVVIVGLLYNFFSVYDGVVNRFLNLAGMESVAFLTSPKWFRPLYIGSGIWQTFGFGSIIYLAAMSGIPIENYEAADVEGANRFQKMTYITLPGLYPTIIVLLILNLGGLLSSGAEKIILMYSPQTYSTGDVIGSFIYRRGIQGSDFGYTTAVGLVSSVINVVFLVTANKIAKTLTEYSLW
jgi:putative aldouronate transport system permease protein